MSQPSADLPPDPALAEAFNSWWLRTEVYSLRCERAHEELGDRGEAWCRAAFEAGYAAAGRAAA